MTQDPRQPIVPDDDDQIPSEQVPFKKSYQPDVDDLDSSNPPQGSGGPPATSDEDESDK